MPIDNRILGEGLVQEKQAGYLRKACFCSNFDFTDEKKLAAESSNVGGAHRSTWKLY